MSKFLLYCILGLISLRALGQSGAINNYVPPEFVGGNQAYINYLNKYLHYPPGELENNRDGDVSAIIFIDHNGIIKEVNTTGNNEVLNKEVKRICHSRLHG